MSCDIKYDHLIFSVMKMSRTNKEYYVFTGSVDNEMRNIFDKLENRKNIAKEEVILLKKNYSDYYTDWIKIVKEKIKIKFLPYKIYIDDSIEAIRKKIFVFMSDPEKKEYILPQNQELWLEKDDGSMEVIGYYYEDEETKEKKFTTPDIYENYAVNESFNEKHYKKNTSENNMLIIDLLEYDKTFKRKVIYLHDALDEERYLLSKKITINEKVINKYFKKYWPYVNLKLDMADVKNNFSITLDYYVKEEMIFYMINHTDKKNSTNFGSCNILTTGFTVAENKDSENFLDLYQVFDYLRSSVIDEKTPFIKYYENILEAPFSIISRKAIDDNKLNKKILKDWLDLNEESKKINRIIVKRFLREYNGEPRYNHIEINKKGVVKLNISFNAINNASFKDVNDAVEDCKKFINNINKNRLVKKSDEIKKIESPEIEMKDNKITLHKNTRITFIKSIIPLKFEKSIDFKKLSDFAKKFPYFIIESKDKINNNLSTEGGKSITFRYKRVSGFTNMNDILFEIDKLKEIYDKNILAIIKILEKKYEKSADEIKGYLLEWERKYSSSKSVKVSSIYKKGISVTISNSNILFHNITQIYQIPLLYNFFTTFLNLFMYYDDFMKNKNFKKVFSSNVKYVENDYEINSNAKLNLMQSYNLDYDFDEELYLNDELNEVEKKMYENKEEPIGINAMNIPGLVGDEEIDPNILLKCEDAVPEKDTCQDFCNDGSYFLRRLQRYDNKLYRIKNEKKKKEFDQYSKKCQNKRQPVILPYDPATNSRIKKDSFTYSLKYSSEPDVMQRWYICPKIWCPYCEIPISESDINMKDVRVKTTKSTSMCKTVICPYGNHQAFIRENNNEIYPGFQKNIQHPLGLCMPCCFAKKQTDPKSAFYKS